MENTGQSRYLNATPLAFTVSIQILFQWIKNLIFEFRYLSKVRTKSSEFENFKNSNFLKSIVIYSILTIFLTFRSCPQIVSSDRVLRFFSGVVFGDLAILISRNKEFKSNSFLLFNIVKLMFWVRLRLEIWSIWFEEIQNFEMFKIHSNKVWIQPFLPIQDRELEIFYFGLKWGCFWRSGQFDLKNRKISLKSTLVYLLSFLQSIVSIFSLVKYSLGWWSVQSVQMFSDYPSDWLLLKIYCRRKKNPKMNLDIWTLKSKESSSRLFVALSDEKKNSKKTWGIQIPDSVWCSILYPFQSNSLIRLIKVMKKDSLQRIKRTVHGLKTGRSSQIYFEIHSY